MSSQAWLSEEEEEEEDVEVQAIVSLRRASRDLGRDIGLNPYQRPGEDLTSGLQSIKGFSSSRIHDSRVVIHGSLF